MKEQRFSKVRKNNVENCSRVYVADTYELSVTDYTVREFCDKFGGSRDGCIGKAKRGDRIYKDSFRYYVCDNWGDAYDLLP